MFALAAAVLSLALPAEVPFTAPHPVAGRAAVRVVHGTTPCELPIRWAHVREGRRRVVVTLVGQVVARDQVCVQSLELGCAEVPLRRRLGSRRVVDGSGRRVGVPAGNARRIAAGKCRRVPRRGAAR